MNLRQCDKKKSENKQVRGILLFKVITTGVIVFLLWRGWTYTKPSNFPIQQVKIVSSYEHVDQKTLQNIIATYTDNGFFYLNVIGMKRQLLKLPWIYAVSVRRKWPDTVIVNIIEQQATLQWGTEALINHKGIIFTPSLSTFPKELPVIFGPKEKEAEIFDLYQKAKNLLEPLDLIIIKLVLNSQHYWEITLDNSTMIYLEENDPVRQIEFLLTLYRRVTAGHKYQPKSIDLRYNINGLAIKWN